MMHGHVLKNSYVVKRFALLVLIVKIKENVTEMRSVGKECAEGEDPVQNTPDQDLMSFLVPMDFNASKVFVSQK